MKTDDRGEFRVNDLLPGPYTVVVRAQGFAEASSDVDVVVSYVRDLLVTLKPAAVQQTVNVQGQASSITTEPIDTASAVHQGAVTSRDLTTIPLAQSQLRQYRISGAGDRAGRAFRSDQGPNHRGLDWRQFRA